MVRAGSRKHPGAPTTTATAAGGPAIARGQVAPAERLAAIVEKCWDGISVHAADGRLLLGNEALGRILGCMPRDLAGRDPFEFVHPEDRALAGQAFSHAIDGRSTGEPTQYRLRHASGEWRTVESVASNLVDDPLVGGVVVTTRDVTQQLLTEARLQRLALHDSVTGLANRAGLHAQLAQMAETLNGALALLYVEVDRFEWMVDARGHAVGDEALRALGARLRANAEGAVVAHLGNGAFVVAIEIREPECSALRVADSVARALARPLRVAGQVIEATTSIGVAFARHATAHPGELLQNAAATAHWARERGGAHVELFDERVVARLERRLKLTNDLRSAVTEKDFRIVYQPIVSIDDGVVRGVEALVRWGRDGGSRYEPDEFIAEAEQTGLIVPLGAWVLEEAVAARAAVGRDLDLKLNVNLSVRQLAEPGLVEMIDSTLSRFELPAGQVAFEVTETLALQDLERAVRVTSDIRALGCHVGIDDFGTGYSSLGHLRQLPVDFIKIDRSFVHALGIDASVDALVEAIVAMARALKLQIVAEGVETDTQLERLRTHGCLHAQGYLFSRPMPSLTTIVRGLGNGRVERELGTQSAPTARLHAVDERLSLARTR